MNDLTKLVYILWAPHGMTPEQYINAVEKQKTAQEQQKLAQQRENEATGILLSKGMNEGLGGMLKQACAKGGDRAAAQRLANFFGAGQLF